MSNRKSREGSCRVPEHTHAREENLAISNQNGNFCLVCFTRNRPVGWSRLGSICLSEQINQLGESISLIWCYNNNNAIMKKINLIAFPCKGPVNSPDISHYELVNKPNISYQIGAKVLWYWCGKLPILIIAIPKIRCQLPHQYQFIMLPSIWILCNYDDMSYIYGRNPNWRYLTWKSKETPVQRISKYHIRFEIATSPWVPPYPGLIAMQKSLPIRLLVPYPTAHWYWYSSDWPL